MWAASWSARSERALIQIMENSFWLQNFFKTICFDELPLTRPTSVHGSTGTLLRKWDQNHSRCDLRLLNSSPMMNNHWIYVLLHITLACVKTQNTYSLITRSNFKVNLAWSSHNNHTKSFVEPWQCTPHLCPRDHTPLGHTDTTLNKLPTLLLTAY